MRGFYQIHQFFVAQKISADLGYPGKLRAGVDDVSQKRLGTFDVNRKVVIDEKNNNLTSILTRMLL